MGILFEHRKRDNQASSSWAVARVGRSQGLLRPVQKSCVISGKRARRHKKASTQLVGDTAILRCGRAVTAVALVVGERELFGR